MSSTLSFPSPPLPSCLYPPERLEGAAKTLTGCHLSQLPDSRALVEPEPSSKDLFGPSPLDVDPETTVFEIALLHGSHTTNVPTRKVDLARHLKEEKGRFEAF